VLVVGRDGTKTDEGNEMPLHPGYLKPGMTVVDLTATGQPSRFQQEAQVRGCAVVSPGRILAEQVREHARRLGADVPADVLYKRLAYWLPDE